MKIEDITGVRMNIIEKMSKEIVTALEDKKGEEIQLIDISEISSIADRFILVSGNNRNQVQAMADAVEENMHKAGFSLKQTEGYDSANWILMDFVDVVVHIFDKESRSFYDLERIWKDGKMMDLNQLRDNFK